jgi:hypothetical protein
LSRVPGVTWLIIVESRFDDWIYLTSVLQLHSIITVHPLNSFWITNPSLHSSASLSKAPCFAAESLLLPLSVVFSLLSESYVTTDGQSANQSWNKALIWGLRPDFYYCQTNAGLLMWGALSDERMGLSFTIAAGRRQRSHSRVRVPWDSRPYFVVSDSRLPFSSPPTTRRATVEVFETAPTPEEYRIADTESNRSFLRCHEKDPSVAVRTNVYIAVVMKTTSPLCRKRLCTLLRRRQFKSRYLCNGFTCHNRNKL